MSRYGTPAEGDCIKIGHPGKSIPRPFLLLRISFPEDLLLYNWSLDAVGAARVADVGRVGAHAAVSAGADAAGIRHLGRREIQ